MAKHKRGVGSRHRRGSMERCPSCGRRVDWVQVGYKLIIVDTMKDGSHKTHQCGRKL